MKKEAIISVIICLAILSFYNVPHATAAEEEIPKVISLGTGAIGGAYNMIGVTVSKYWDKDLGIKAKVIPGLNLSNLVRFDEGNMDTLISSSSWGLAAWNGDKDQGFTKQIRSFRVLGYICDDLWYFVTLKKSGLKNISELKGKRVGCGAKAAVFDKMIGNRIEANGLKYFGDKADIQKVYSSYEDQARLLVDGKLDAMLGGLSGTVPSPAIRQLMEENELSAIEFNQEAIDYKDVYFPSWLIKKETLPFFEKDYYGIHTGRASVVVQERFSENLAYMMTKSIHINLKKMGEENPYWEFAAKNPNVMTYDWGVPYHPGAIKYWKEVGLWKN